MQQQSPATTADVLVRVAELASSPNAAEREWAEATTKEYQDSVDQQTGFVTKSLELATSGAACSLFVSILLKNTVKRCWNPATAEHCIQESEKAQIRQSIIGLMLSASPAVQRSLTETIALIADVDFPTAWPGALQPIVNALTTSDDVALCYAAFSTAHSILRKYRLLGELTEGLVEELRTIYTVLFPPFLQEMEALLTVAQAGRPGTDVTVAYRGITAGVETLRDMTSLDLGDEFLSRIESVVNVLLRCLSVPIQLPVAAGSIASTVIAMKSAVLSCVTHLLSAFDEDFEPYAPQFLNVVFGVVSDRASSVAEMDDLVVCGLQLLSGACRGTTRSYFDDAEKITALIESVIVPNLVLRDEDVAIYTYEPDAYIQRDIEGSDFHTRRRAALDLVHSLITKLPDKARPAFSAEITQLLERARQEWKYKDVAIYLASSLVVEGQHVDTQRGATTQPLGSVVDFSSFLMTVVIPELSAPSSEHSPLIIKADCIRVIALFRNCIDSRIAAGLVSVLGEWIARGDRVVMSYAAHALDRLLSVQVDQAYVLTEEVFAPYTRQFLEILCVRIGEVEAPNTFLMQCLMRICFRVPSAVAPDARNLVGSLNTALTTASRNPSNPLFSHCMFEVLSKCVAIQPTQVDDFESILWPNLIYILSENVIEYVPYALQILAQLLRKHQPQGPEPPVAYQSLLPPLTLVAMYEHRGNIPAVVNLLCTFLELYPDYVHRCAMTNDILHIFAFLVRLKNYDHEGLNIVTTMLLSYPGELMDTFMSAILNVLFTRLNTARTPKFVRILILFLSVVVITRGASNFIGRMNAIQPGLFMMLLDRVWLPHMQKVSGALERKTCVVALAKLLCDSAELQSDGGAWTSSVFSCLKMIYAEVERDDLTSFSPTSGTLLDLSKLQSGPTEAEFTNVFCPLQEAALPVRDVCVDIPDANAYFRERMRDLLHSNTALRQQLQGSLPPNMLQLVE